MESGPKQGKKEKGSYSRLRTAFRSVYDYFSPQARLDKEVREFTDRMHAEGWKLFDIHGHTWRSDGATEPDEYAEIAKRRGLDFVAVTDHDSNAGWWKFKKASEKLGIVPVKGREVTMYDEDDVNIGHVLVLPPDSIPISKIDTDLAPNQPFEQTLKHAKRMGAYTSFPHPTSLDGVRAENVKKYADLKLVDSVADDGLAKETGIRSVKGSDAHTKLTIGLRGTLIKDPEGKIKTGNDLIRYLKEGGEVVPYELHGGSYIDAVDIASKVSNVHCWPKGIKNFWYKFMTRRGLDMLGKDLHEYFAHTLPTKIRRNKGAVKKVAALTGVAAGAGEWALDDPAAGTPKHFIGSTLIGAGVYHFSKKSKNPAVKYGAPVAAALGAELLYKFYVEPAYAGALNKALGKLGVFGDRTDYGKLLEKDIPATVGGASVVPLVDNIEAAEGMLVKGYDKLKEKFRK